MTNDFRVWRTIGTKTTKFRSDFVDERGRRIGSIVTIYDDRAEPPTPGEIEALERYGWVRDRTDQPVGAVRFGFWCQAARDGNRYGASQPVHWFASPRERDAAVNRHLDAAMRRAGKVRGARSVLAE